MITVVVRSTDEDSNQQALEVHDCDDPVRAGWLVQMLLEAGLPPRTKIEVSVEPELDEEMLSAINDKEET